MKGDSVLSVKDMDEIEFKSHDTPGVNLRKGSLNV